MKRILSLIISVSLILSLFAFMPVSVSADESNITWIEVDQEYYDKNIKGKSFQKSTEETASIKSSTEIMWYFKLTEDIIADDGIKNIGSRSDDKSSNVIIDGQNHTLTLTGSTVNTGVGFVDLIGANNPTSSHSLEIKNLNIKVNITGDALGAGAVVGYAHMKSVVNLENVTILDGSYVESIKVNNYTAVGGIIGAAVSDNIVMTNVKNYADVKSEKFAGGLIGYAQSAAVNARLTSCANYGSVTGTAEAAGLIVAAQNLAHNITVDKCFNTSASIVGSATAALCYFRGTGTQGKATGCVKNSFNSVDGNADYFAYSNSPDFMVENCYNAGGITNFVTDYTTLLNCYYLENSITGNNGGAASVTETELADNAMLTLLGDSFEFVTLDASEYYKYPQIKENTLYFDYKKFAPYNASYTDNSSKEKGVITGLTDWETEENAKDFTDIFKVSEPGYYISSLYSYPGILGTTVIKTTDTMEAFSVDKIAIVYLATEFDPVNITGLSDAGFEPLPDTDFLALKNGKKYYLSSKTTGQNETVALGEIAGLTGKFTVFVKWVECVKVNVESFENAQVKINGKDIVSGVYEFAKASLYTLTVTPDRGYYVESIIIDNEVKNDGSAGEVSLSGAFDSDTDINISVKKYGIDNLEIINETVNNTDTTPGAPAIVQKVTVKGNAKKFMAGENAVFTLTDNTAQPPVSVTGEATVSADGSLVVVIETNKFDDIDVALSLTVGAYNINLADYGYETLEFPALKDVNDFLAKLDKNSQERFDENELTAHILDGNKAPAFDTDVFKLLTTAEQLKVAEDILSYNGVYDIDKINELYNDYTLKAAFYKQANKLVIEKAISKYHTDEFLKLSEDLYDEFLASDDKDDIYTLMSNKPLSTVEEIKEAFKVAVALSKVRKVDNYSNILSALNEYNGKVSDPSLTALLTSYSNMTDAKIDAASEYILKNYTKLSDKASVVNIVSYAVTNAQALLDEKLKENIGNVVRPPSGNRGGGGGGGGGSVSVIEKPNTTVDNQDETSKPEVIEPVVQFNDIQNVSWAGEAINELFKMGVLQGREPGKFYPHDNITRAEFVKIVVTLFNLYDETAKASFTDVTKDNWAYTYVASALKEGIANGKSVSYFGADENITREEMAVMLTAVIYRLSEHEKLDERMTAGNKFTDGADISSFAENPVNMLSAEGLISGYEDGTFKPKNNSTRAEATHLIYTVYKYILK